MLSRKNVASIIDHTLLKPEATKEDIALFIQEAIQLGVGAICISPSHLPLSDQQAEHLKQAGIRLATVVGFPSGAHIPAVKATEARAASLAGAEEIDMVINLALRDNMEALEAEIRAVREATPGILKVIIESAALSREEIIAISQVVESSGADFIKTSTGFHPAGGASVEAVEIMKEVLGDRLGIKASGGIRDATTAEAMIAAGATRLGVSSSAQILASYKD